MPDEPQTDLERVGDMVRQRAFRGRDYYEGQKMLNTGDAAAEAMGRPSFAGMREIRGLEDDEFDGFTALADAKERMVQNREEREARLGSVRRKR